MRGNNWGQDCKVARLDSAQVYRGFCCSRHPVCHYNPEDGHLYPTSAGTAKLHVIGRRHCDGSIKTFFELKYNRSHAAFTASGSRVHHSPAAERRGQCHGAKDSGNTMRIMKAASQYLRNKAVKQQRSSTEQFHLIPLAACIIKKEITGLTRPSMC